MNQTPENTIEDALDARLVLEVDKEADAAYLSLQKGTVRRTVEIAPGLMADVDATGKVLGLEIVGLDIVDITGS